MHDGRLQFMAALDARRLDDALRREDVSVAWMVWSGAAETAPADAFCFAAGLVPDRVFCFCGVWHNSGWPDLVDLRGARLATMLLILLTVEMSLRLVTHPLHPVGSEVKVQGCVGCIRMV